MKIAVKKLKELATLTIVSIIALGTTCKLQAQDKYSFATLSNQFDSRNDDAIYLVISDPVKNWYNLSKEEQEDWKAEFRTSANRQIGKDFVTKYAALVPYNGDWKAFSSMAKAKEAIQDEVSKFKNDYAGNTADKRVKIIYVNMRQY